MNVPRFTLSRRRTAAGLAAAALCFPLAACGSTAADGEDSSGSVKLRYASPLGEQSSQDQLIKDWITDIGENSDGRISVKPFYDGSLIAAEDSLAAVADRRTDLALGSAQYHPGELPISSVTELPFVTRDTVAYVKAIRDAYENNEEFAAEYHAVDAEVLLFVPVGGNTIISNEPVTSMDDLDGMSVRAVGRTASAMEIAGASPQSVPIGEAYEGLERGLFDAVSTISANVAFNVGILDAAPHIYDGGFGEYTVSILIASKSWYDGLSDDDRAAIERATDAFYEGLDARLAEIEDELCTQMLEKHVELTVWEDSEVERWDAAAGEQIRADWVDQVSDQAGIDAGAFLDDYLASVEEYESDSDFEPLVSSCAAKQ